MRPRGLVPISVVSGVEFAVLVIAVEDRVGYAVRERFARRDVQMLPNARDARRSQLGARAVHPVTKSAQRHALRTNATAGGSGCPARSQSARNATTLS